MQLQGLFDPIVLRSALKFLHFLGLALGLGTATFLDLIILRFMVRGKIRPTHWRVFQFGSLAVTVGLVLLWISGIGFLVWYSAFEPEHLYNPKIWAKISIVWVLTVNAAYLHILVLPILSQQVGRTLFADLTAKQRTTMLIGGIISVVSWYFPVGIAASPWLNFTVALGVISGTYLLVLALALIVGLAGSALWVRRAAQREREGRPQQRLTVVSGRAQTMAFQGAG